MKKKKLSLSKLKKKAWKILSNYIRIMSANADGFVQCFTCSVIKHWKKMQAGHFVSGRSGWILFNEENIRVQCYVCNCILSGNWPTFFENMVKEVGLAKTQALIELKNKPMSSTEMLNECERVISLYGGITQKGEN